MSTFQTILEKYRKYSFSERDKGTRFEILIKRYFMADPKYASQLKSVWLWNDFPYRKDFGGKDTGIDLVAITNDGDYWAIQCKCYKEDANIDKPAVDSFLATSSKTFRDDEMEKCSFARRLWVSTTNHWGPNAEETIHNQRPPVWRINLTDLDNAPIDWIKLDEGKAARNKPREPLPHQETAVNKAHEYFKTKSRGKLIMACGTGKTYTSLRIAEKETDGKGLILVLVPSIALMGQTLRAWYNDAVEHFEAICICSDAEVSKTKEEDGDASSVEELAMPATTSIPTITARLRKALDTNKDGMTVVFSTYQSIEVVSKAQKELDGRRQNNCVFDLIICDEAHRTTGVTLAGNEESAFVKVHDDDFIAAKRRMYMTATPRLYKEAAKKAAEDKDAVLCSMDDEKLYGEEIYRLGFGESVDLGLLADYKVVILTIDDSTIKNIPVPIREMVDKSKSEDAVKLIGCINALAKREGKLIGGSLIKDVDPEPMKRAVAFCQNIAISKLTTEAFQGFEDIYYNNLTAAEREEFVNVQSQHVDGTMSASTRDDKLTWLKNDTKDRECRILTNVRCLSEGVDVPALDAVLFLSARNSEIDVVQSVGRVMRTSPGKKYGYIIIPIIISPDEKPEEALDDDLRYKVVWDILNALRAHDDRYDSKVENIRFTKTSKSIITIGGRVEDPYNHEAVGEGEPGTENVAGERVASPNDGYGYVSSAFMQKFDELRDVIYAKLVIKVGSKQYWEQWASEVAAIAKRDIERIRELIKKDGKHKDAFDRFLLGLQKNLNPSISQEDAIEMLSQHIITRPVFEALFKNYSFVKNNPVSVQMQEVLDLFNEQTPQEDLDAMERFYNSVKRGVQDIDSAEGRQHVIKELYEKFFKQRSHRSWINSASSIRLSKSWISSSTPSPTCSIRNLAKICLKKASTSLTRLSAPVRLSPDCCRAAASAPGCSNINTKTRSTPTR